MQVNVRDTRLPNLVLLLDVSGSMGGVVDTVNQNLRPLFEGIQSGSIPVNLMWNTFDNSLSQTVVNDIRNSRAFSRGGTNLYGCSVDLIKRLTSTLGPADKTMIIVISDGGDTEHCATPDDVANEVHVAEEVMGWDFLFVGTSQNAYRVGESMGVKPGKALTFVNTDRGFADMLQALTNITKQWAMGNIAHDATFFTQEVKEACSR